MKSLVSVPALLLVVASMAEGSDYQMRMILSPTVKVSDCLAISSLVVGNGMERHPDNINLFGGLKYSEPSWWTSAMLQRQWNSRGNQWMLDLRFQANLGKKGMVFANVAPFLTKRSTAFSFFWVERRITSRLGAGLEVDNVHKPGRDSLGLGPRITYLLSQNSRMRLAVSTSYQLRRSEPNVLRLYFVAAPRF